MRLSKKNGLPWLANWNDPWNFLREPHHSGGLTSNIGIRQAIFCKKVSSNASLNTFPSEKLRQAMSGYLSIQDLKKTYCIPHISLNHIHYEQPQNNRFTITFCGRLWKYQDPSPFFQALSEFLGSSRSKNIAVIFVGHDDVGVTKLASRYNLQDVVSYKGTLSYKESLCLMGKSDALLLIDPPDAQGLLLTSKLVDYASVGRPILAVTTKGSETESMLRAHGGGAASDYFDINSIINNLGIFYNAWSANLISDTYSSTSLAEFFSSDSILSIYERIFNTLCMV